MANADVLSVQEVPRTLGRVLPDLGSESLILTTVLPSQPDGTSSTARRFTAPRFRFGGSMTPLDTIKISIESTRLTLTATHAPDDLEGLRQTLALLQTFLRSVLGEGAGPQVRIPRKPRSPKNDGGAA